MSDRYGLAALLVVRARELASARRALADAEAALTRQREACVRAETQVGAWERAARSGAGAGARPQLLDAATLAGAARYRRRAHGARRRAQTRLALERQRLDACIRTRDAARVLVERALRASTAVDAHRRAWLASARARRVEAVQADLDSRLAAVYVDERRVIPERSR